MRSAAEIVLALKAKGFDPKNLRLTHTETFEVDSDRPDNIEGTATRQ